MLKTNKPCLSWQTSYRLKNNIKFNTQTPMEIAYGYAITYWKAQGSEWDKVVVVEEDFPYDKETHARAMYTAATRASKKLVWLR